MRVGSATTTAGQIAHLVESAPIGDTRMQNHAELFADRLVMPTLGLAAGTAADIGDFNRFLSLVIVDYGTGIRVAAPTSVLSSMTHAARAGIIIKSGGHMEKLAEARHRRVRQDRHADPRRRPRCRRHPYQRSHHAGPSARPRGGGRNAAAASGRGSACASARGSSRVNIPPCDETKYRIGLGVEGQVNGYYLHVGNERFMRQSDINVDAAALDRAALDRNGYSCLYIAVDGKLAGLVPLPTRFGRKAAL